MACSDAYSCHFKKVINMALEENPSSPKGLSQTEHMP